MKAGTMTSRLLTQPSSHGLRNPISDSCPRKVLLTSNWQSTPLLSTWNACDWPPACRWRCRGVPATGLLGFGPGHFLLRRRLRHVLVDPALLHHRRTTVAAMIAATNT